MSDYSISKWKTIYNNEEAKRLQLKYKDGTGFLTESQHFEIAFHLKNNFCYHVE